MQFNNQSAIYLQIAGYMYDQILSGAWANGERIPSIRDMAVQLEVNPNTVTRTYTLLQEEGTLENRRGIGYFTSSDAQQRVLETKRVAFMHKELPALFSTMQQLGITESDLVKQLRTYQEEQTSHEKK
jgi:DNA-binding transcriptional regulator YhcF (GntR family)